MLSFGAVPFVLQVAIQKFKYQDIYRTIILPVVLYGCETWSLTLREERKLRVFENMVLRRIFGPRRYEVTGEWRRLHNEEVVVVEVVVMMVMVVAVVVVMMVVVVVVVVMVVVVNIDISRQG